MDHIDIDIDWYTSKLSNSRSYWHRLQITIVPQSIIRLSNCVDHIDKHVFPNHNRGSILHSFLRIYILPHSSNWPYWSFIYSLSTYTISFIINSPLLCNTFCIKLPTCWKWKILFWNPSLFCQFIPNPWKPVPSSHHLIGDWLTPGLQFTIYSL